MVYKDVEWESLQDEAKDVKVWDMNSATAFMRAAYGKGYVYGLENPVPNVTTARLLEREAWARLPV